mgnify:CR=1 FL=1
MGESLIAFNITPVQPFIAAARTARDLWSGSYILSWLTMHALRAAEQAGARIVFPSVQDNPLYLRLGGALAGFTEQDASRILQPSIPNLFLASAQTGGMAATAASAATAAAREEWLLICGSVRQSLAVPGLEGWDALWDDQVENFWSVRVNILPEDTGAAEAALASVLPKDDFSPRRFLLNRLIDADKRSGTPLARPGGMPGEALRDHRSKCTLFGTHSQMGWLTEPAKQESESRRFWEQAQKHWNITGTRIREQERLCALALAKRFAWPCYFSAIFDADPRLLRFNDTATVAARCWLDDNKLAEGGTLDSWCWKEHRDKSWSGQWLHAADDADGDDAAPPDVAAKIKSLKRKASKTPPAYYAILMLDGDKMGQTLQELKSDRDHSEFSRQLGSFSLNTVPRIVKEHSGQTIYCGGDDVLAMLPTETAMACAVEIKKAFASEVKASGKPMTLSGALVVSHYKSNLREALETARASEKAAKNAGRNRLAITLLRRSGEHTTALCRWTEADKFSDLVNLFVSGASDRWVYRLRQTIEPMLDAPEDQKHPIQAIANSELKRLLKRAEDASSVEGLSSAGDALWDAATGKLETGMTQNGAIVNALHLIHSAAFMARGRDE